MIGAFTQQIDLAQVLILAFVVFWFGLLYYLRTEDKREGYPLEEAIPGLGHSIVGFPTIPAPKTYRLQEGGTVTLPQEYERRELKATPRELFPGAPLYPVGEPLLAGIGPGAYALRRDEPFRMIDGSPQLEPLRVLKEYYCVDPEMDPRGMRVLGCDLKEAGTVTDVWFDKGSKIPRYVEVALDGIAEHRLVPIFYANIQRKASGFTIDCVKASQLSMAPVLRDPDIITAREEDRINGFYAGGHMYSTPLREALR